MKDSAVFLYAMIQLIKAKERTFNKSCFDDRHPLEFSRDRYVKLVQKRTTRKKEEGMYIVNRFFYF